MTAEDGRSDRDPETEPDAETETPRDDERPPRRSRKALLLLGLPLLLILLIGWNRAASSDRFCASCHAAGEAVASAERAVHADVPCIACHSGPGLLGTVTYVPTLLREGVAQVTGWGAGGILKARPCASCHPALSQTTHPDPQASCAECHGNVSHPISPSAGAPPFLVDGDHPDGFIQVHGAPAVAQPTACSRCHESKFCEACHLQETFPHREGWISRHGTVQETRGSSWCETCHGPSFCSGCHGTEIPHRPDWLGRHDTALRDVSTTPCLTCHPEPDCAICHAEHLVHREQDLYIIPSPQPLPPGGGR